MTQERREVLERLAQVAPDMAYVCSGAHRTRCVGLEAMGYALQIDDLGDGRKAFRITDAGRAWLEANP